MNKIILISALFALVQLPAFGQTQNEKIVYVVDSIPVIEDPEYGNEISQNDISEVNVIKDKEKLKLLGYEKFDAAIYFFTIDYKNRPDSIRKIPSSKQMERKDDVWFYKGAPFNGRFIDYYYSGRKEGEGILLNGKLNGYRVKYYQNNEISISRTYKEGISDGTEKAYYQDGSLKQKGEFINGNEEGVWESYFPNGQVKLRTNYVKGEVTGNAVKYYSNGKVLESVFVKNGKVSPDANNEKLTKLMTNSENANKNGDFVAAIKYCSKAIELDITYANAYFSRGTIKLNHFQFDEAIADFDKALQLEPYTEFAFANRAFARIRKYEFGNSRTISHDKEVTILATKNQMPVPPEEHLKICSDLKTAIFLGDKNEMVLEALTKHCQ